MADRMDRREFLRLGALGAAGLAISPLPEFSVAGLTPFPVLPASTPPIRRADAPTRVIVIGAGLAGLAAAYEMARAGHDVVVLEAQTRAGGRVLTHRAPLADGLHGEAGAGRVPDNHDWVRRYTDEFGLQLVPAEPDHGATVHYMRGRRIPVPRGRPPDLAAYPVRLRDRERALGMDGLAREIFGPVVQAAGDSSQPDWLTGPVAEYDGQGVVEFVEKRGYSPDSAALLALGYLDPDGSADYSVVMLLREIAHALTETTKLTFQDGNDRLPAALAERLADRIRYGAPVVRIEQDENGASAVYRQAGALRILTGDRIIVAVPFSVLRDVEFHPPLPRDKARAIRELFYVSAARVTLQIRQRYFEAEGLNGFGKLDLPGEVWHPTFDQPGERGLLQLYYRLEASERLTSLPEDQRIQHGIDYIDRVLPGVREHVEGGVAKCWDEDPWARGAICVPKPGQASTLLPIAARKEGRLHFAGEHTSAWLGWMQGALESGNRAAREAVETV